MSLSADTRSNISIPTDYLLGHFISAKLWPEARETLDLMIDTAENIEEKGFDQPRAFKLYSIVKEILGSCDNTELCSTLYGQLKEIKAIGFGIISSDEYVKWTQIADKVASFLEKTKNEVADESPFQLPKKKAPSIRIWEHNHKAKEAQRLLESNSTGFNSYPATIQEKDRLKALRVPVSKMSEFIDNPNNKPLERVQLLSETVQMPSCSVEIASTIGQRPYMEDRYLATPFSFQANGQVFQAELFGLFDGHNGVTTVEFVQNAIAQRLQEKLEELLKNKDLTETAIFYALKETVSSLHEDVQSNRNKDGTTAVIGFKLANADKLYIANVGDSRAYLNRNGKLIPLSIDQKPYLVKEESQNIYYNNEYAHQLFKRGIEISKDLNEDYIRMVNESKMFLSPPQFAEGNLYHMQLGISGECYLDMTRSIGDLYFDPWKKFTPEIFSQTVLYGDQLIIHSDGVNAPMKSVVKVVEDDKRNGFSTRQTVEDLVHASLDSEDNITAMIVSFHHAR